MASSTPVRRQATRIWAPARSFDAVVDLWGGQVVMTPDQLTDARPVAPIDYAADLEAPQVAVAIAGVASSSV